MDQQYTRRLEKIEAALELWLPERGGAAWMEAIFPGLGKGGEHSIGEDSLRSLTAPLGDLLSRGGKRWRPLLMTLICESLGGGDAALPLAPLVEFCHNASLIHDDIEDNSDERRGKPAVHVLYGEDTAINSGSFLYFLPLSCVGPWAAELEKQGVAPNDAAVYKNKVYEIWGAYMRKLHLGQAMDIYWHRNFSVVPNIEEYYTMCALKTGCLARFAAVLGVCAAEAAGAPQKVAANAALSPGEAPPSRVAANMAIYLGEGAEKLGVGFQILDDVKNLTTGIPGKKRGDDIVEGKKSLPVLLYLNRYPEQAGLVSRCFAAARSGGASVPEVEELIGVLDAAGALDEAKKRGLALIAEARETFAVPYLADSQPEAAALLAGLAGLIS
jgi:octaprenyl-diphosphate synthase